MSGLQEEADSFINIAHAYIRIGNLTKAQEFADKAEKQFPSDKVIRLKKKIANKKQNDSSSQTEFNQEHLNAVHQVNNCKTLYEMLQVNRDSTDTDIRKAFKRIALSLHPDKNHATGAEEAFKAASNAFKCLTKLINRRIYNTFLDAVALNRFYGHDASHYPPKWWCDAPDKTIEDMEWCLNSGYRCQNVDCERQRKNEKESQQREEEARKRSKEEAKKRQEEARQKSEEESRKQSEGKARKRQEKARKKREKRLKRKLEKQAEEEARRQQEEARQKYEEELRKRSEEAARKRVEEARQKYEEELRKRSEEAARKRVEEARRQQEEARQKFEEEEAARKRVEEARQLEEFREQEETSIQKFQEEIIASFMKQSGLFDEKSEGRYFQQQDKRFKKEPRANGSMVASIFSTTFKLINFSMTNKIARRMMMTLYAISCCYFPMLRHFAFYWPLRLVFCTRIGMGGLICGLVGFLSTQNRKERGT